MTTLVNTVMALACIILVFPMLMSNMDDRCRTHIEEHKELYETEDINKNQT